MVFVFSPPWTFAEQAPAADQPRIVILNNAKKRHYDEYDGALKELGWNAEKVLGTPENIESLTGRLGEFDILIVAPVFKFDEKPAPMSAEARAKYRKIY